MNYEIINIKKRELGLTNAQLSEKTGITVSTLDKITAGANQNPKLGTLQAIARVIGCSLDDFDDLLPASSDFSPAALDIARQYDQLDVPGQRLVNAVINEESARIAQYGRLDNQYRERVADLLKRIPETPSPLQAAGQGE